MTNILDVAYKWTIVDYHKMVETGVLKEDAAVELLNGQIIKMSPAGDLHAACVDILDELLRDILGKSVNIRAQGPVVLNDYSEPEPDIAILKRKKNFYADGHPQVIDVILLIEVSDTTLIKDQTVKREAYATSGISEYWIVNLPDRQLEQYLFPADGDYQQVRIYKEGQVLESEVIGTIAVSDIIP